MFKKVLLTMMLVSVASVASAQSTSLVKLTKKPVFSEEGVTLYTNKGKKIFYTVSWIEDDRMMRNFKELDRSKRGNCLKITTLNQEMGEVWIRKAPCGK